LVGGDEAGADGVQVDIVASGAEVVATALVDDEGFVTAAELVAEKLAAAIEAACVGAQEPFHAGDEIGLGPLGDEMEMISHEAEGVDLPAGFFAGLAQGAEERAAVGVVAKSGFAVVAPAHEMVNGAGELYAQGPGHEAMASAVARIVNC